MKILPLLLQLGWASCQTILNLDNNFPELSQLAALIRASPHLTALLRNANNFTFLAPSNDAIYKWRSQVNPTQDFIEATLSYHLITVNVPSLLLGTEPTFLPTNLVNASYTNVTGGQRVDGYRDRDVGFRSGNRTVSMVVSKDHIVDGGIFHIVDTVLRLPLDFGATASQASWSYALAYFSQSRFSAFANNTIVNELFAAKDLTFFIPNSASALDYALHGNISNPSIQTYGEISRYHFITGKALYSPELKNGSVLTMASGHSAIIRILENGTKYINSAMITSPDYLISNGVVHIIDNFLVPGNTTGPVLPPSSSIASTSTITPATSPGTTKNLSTASYIGIGIGGAAFVLISVAVVTFLMIRRHKAKTVSARNGAVSGVQSTELKGSDPRYYIQELGTGEVMAELPDGNVVHQNSHGQNMRAHVA
ncbi:hypothetical protein BGZ60DRAFT_432449 [Tricladium varicosporioides]|nr:hypothetical protein BGZ60DRAFT_432449 [Hymenoscyphus varicosporioides]